MLSHIVHFVTSCWGIQDVFHSYAGYRRSHFNKLHHTQNITLINKYNSLPWIIILINKINSLPPSSWAHLEFHIAGTLTSRGLWIRFRLPNLAASVQHFSCSVARAMRRFFLSLVISLTDLFMSLFQSVLSKLSRSSY